MAYASISKPGLHFNTKLYTGNASTQSITGIGFQPDFCWFKVRNNTDTHAIFDAVRGATKRIIPNDTSVEGTQSNGVTSFDSDGFTSGDANITNGSGRNYVSWNWKAGGSGSANTDGSINTASTSVNSTAKFSISKYTGTGSAGATIGHGLGVKPSMIIVKGITYAEEWEIYHTSLGATKTIKLNNTVAASTTSSRWNDTEPTSSVFTVGNADATNKSGYDYIAYCFAEKKGFSKFGEYTGNGSGPDGTFVYTGFKPAFVIIKRTDDTRDWFILDNKRDTGNPLTQNLESNNSDAEYASERCDFLSNGFILTASSGGSNASGANYVYMAFAEEPLVANVSNSIPATAR